jgi:hypothetical protein
MLVTIRRDVGSVTMLLAVTAPSGWAGTCRRLWVPKTCATWPDAPLTAGCSATRSAHARPVLACQGMG